MKPASGPPVRLAVVAVVATAAVAVVDTVAAVAVAAVDTAIAIDDKNSDRVAGLG